jgi:putative selenate reductase
MAVFLMEEMGLHVTVKLNPTLLGKEAVDGLLHEVLGYTDVETRAQDFEKDLQWAQALEMTDRLVERARALGRELRLKLSNTLVVRNHRSVFPPGEAVMYLSGPPLHVITVHLVERLRRARPAVPLSFSAGVDNRNFADCVALGLAPVTVCTDLLKPGGYGRLPKYLENLEERMRGLGVRTIGDYVAAAALDPAAAVASATADPRYRAGSLRPPRKIGRHLALFDCINCDKCLPACPNDANFVYEVQPAEFEYADYRVEGGQAVPVAGRRLVVHERHQIATFQDFCNDCGNCDTFCPEDGGPYLEKPRFFGSLAAWRRLAGRDGFHVERRGGRDLMRGRLGGVEYRLEVDRGNDQAVFTDGRVMLEFRHRDRAPVGASVAPGTPDGHALDVGAYLSMAALLDGVLDPARVNPVNA